MAAPTIRPNGIRPTGDDQQWKKEEARVNADLIAAVKALQSQVAALQGRVH